MAKIRDTFQKPPSGWKVTDPITGVRFDANSYRNLRGKIITHRKSNSLTVDGIDDWIAEQICAKNDPAFCQAWPNLTQSVMRMLGFDGPALWAELHERALEREGEQDFVWLDMWRAKIPKYGCSCQSKWKELMHRHPPDWSNYFRWTVFMHNKVSESLGKPTLTEQQARQIWPR